MATIGELLDQLKGKGADADPIRPEPTGTTAYTAIDSDGNPQVGTYDPTVVIDQDDIPDSVKEKVRDYLYAKTSGEGDIRDQNFWPVGADEPFQSSLLDTNGNPSPKTKPAYGFIASFEEALGEAITIFEEEASFFNHGADASTPLADLIDKNIQEHGHSILLDGDEKVKGAINEVLEEAHPKSRERTSASLQNNRFSRGYTSPTAGFATGTGIRDLEAADGFGVGTQSPVTGRVKDLKGYTPDRPFISPDEMDSTFLNRDPGAFWDGSRENLSKPNYDAAPWKTLDNWSGQWDSIKGDGFEAWEEKYDYAVNLKNMLAKWNTDTPDWWYIGKMSWLMAFILKVVLNLIGTAFGLLGKAIGNALPKADQAGKTPATPSTPGTHEREFGSSWKTKVDYSPPPEPLTGLAALAAAAAEAAGIPDNGGGEDLIEKVMSVLGLPIPFNTVKALGGDYDTVWEAIFTEPWRILATWIGNDETMINYFRPILGHFLALMDDMEKWRPPEAPILYVVDMYIYMFSKSPIIRMIRALMIMLEAYFASGGDWELNTEPGQQFYENWSVDREKAPFRSRTMMVGTQGDEIAGPRNHWTAAQGLRLLPSMYLLPAAIYNIGTAGQGPVGVSPNAVSTPSLYQNQFSNPKAYQYTQASKYDGTAGQAAASKLGTPQVAENTRFSPEEVNFMENLLEQEHMPFYIQDLRTNEVIAFHAFLGSLSDSFSPSFKASSGFGRIEDVQIYEKTGRSISLTFTMVAMAREDMPELYWKLNKLVTLVYPQWSDGTLMEGQITDGEPVLFRQPFSQIPTASPLIRLRVGDLIKNNYSKLNMMKLFGAQDVANFLVPSAGTDAEALEKKAAQATLAKNKAKSRDAVGGRPISDTGEHDSNGKGWPIGARIVFAPTMKYPWDISDGLKWTKQKHNTNKGQQSPVVEIVSYHKDVKFDKSKRNNIFVKVKLVDDGTIETQTDRELMTITSKGTGIGLASPDDNQWTYICYDEILTDASMAICWAANKPQFAKEHGHEEAKAFTKDDIEKIQQAGTKIFDPAGNPYFKSFESSMGRGLAGVVNSLSFNYKLNEAPWEIDPGSRGPTMIEVSLGFTPIHDIQPGLDAQGGNRAPVFPMAENDFGQDSWSATQQRNATAIKSQKEANEHFKAMPSFVPKPQKEKGDKKP